MTFNQFHLYFHRHRRGIWQEDTTNPKINQRIRESKQSIGKPSPGTQRPDQHLQRYRGKEWTLWTRVVQDQWTEWNFGPWKEKFGGTSQGNTLFYLPDFIVVP